MHGRWPGVAESLLYRDFGATAEDKGNEDGKEKEGEEVVNGLIPAGARNCESGELPLMPTTRERADTVLTADGNSTVGASILRSSSPGFRPSTAQTLDSRRVGSSRSSTATKRVSFAGELGDTPLQTPRVCYIKQQCGEGQLQWQRPSSHVFNSGTSCPVCSRDGRAG